MNVFRLLFPAESFGCAPVFEVIKVQNASMELLEIPEVDSPLVCVHICKFGTEATCNFIEHDRETQTCVLAHVPPDRYMRSRDYWVENSNRTFCMETG